MNNKQQIDTSQIMPFLDPVDFFSDLDQDALLEAIKSNPSVARRILSGGFRDTRNSTVQNRLLAEAKDIEFICEMLLCVWAKDHVSLLKTIKSMSISEINDSLSKLASQEGGRNLCIAMILDGRKKLAKMAEKHGGELINIKRAKEQAPPQDSHKVPKQTSSLDGKLKDAKNQLRDLRKQLTQTKRELIKLEHRTERLEKEKAKLKERLTKAEQSEKEYRDRAQKFLRERDKEKEKTEEQRRVVSELRTLLDHQPRPERPAAPHEQAWKSAVEQLIEAEKTEAAAEFLEAFVKNDMHNCVTPLELLVVVYRNSGRHDKQAEALKMLSDCHLKCNRLVEAIEAAAKALDLIPQWLPAVENIKEALSRINLKQQHRISAIRVLLCDRNSISEETAERIVGLAYGTSLELAEALRDHRVSRKVCFSLNYGGETRSFTPQKIIEAIYEKDEETVKFLRGALKTLKKEAKCKYNEIKSELDQIDKGCWTVLTCKTEPVVMDASNVAYAHCVENGKPMLKNIRRLRSALYEKKYFPVHICADAALRYKVVEGEREFDRMMEEEGMESADGGTDADVRIIQIANFHGCKVVTRDCYKDVDPEGKVKRIEFEIDEDFVCILDY